MKVSLPKRRVREIDAVETYAFEIGEIEPYYSFGLGPFVDSAPYDEFAQLRLHSVCVWPAKQKGLPLTATLNADREREVGLIREGKERWLPRAVAFLELSKRGGSVSMHVPNGTFWGLRLALQDKAFTVFTLSGEKLYRGSGLMTSFNFATEFHRDLVE